MPTALPVPVEGIIDEHPHRALSDALARLYALPAGYPVLEVPEQHILAQGAADPLADAAVQVRLTATMDLRESLIRPFGDWDRVHGQLIELADPRRSLPPIDRLEGYYPGERSLYQRVLIPVFLNQDVRLCWTYIMPGCAKCHRLRDGRWRSGGQIF